MAGRALLLRIPDPFILQGHLLGLCDPGHQRRRGGRGLAAGQAGGEAQAEQAKQSAQVAPASARGLCFPLRRIGHACFLKRSCTSFMVPALKPSLKELGTTMRLLPPPSFTLSFTMLAMRIWSAISSWRYSSAAPT